MSVRAHCNPLSAGPHYLAMDCALEHNAIFLKTADARQLAEFHAWERAAGVVMAARWELIPSRPAFEPRDADVPMRDPAFTLEPAARGIVMTNASAGRRVTLEIDRAQADLVLAAVDGRSDYGTLRDRLPPAEREAFASAFRQLLGNGITVPDAIDRLERRLPLAQLVRFPQQSPYALPRPYWENSIAIRESLPVLYRSADDSQAFVTALRGFHRVALLGESGGNYYGSASGVTTSPGELRQSVVCTVISDTVLRTLARWQAHLGVPAPLLTEGVLLTRGGDPVLEMRDQGSRCFHVCTDGDPAMQAMLEDARLELIRARAAIAGRSSGALVAACARFHQLFVSAHPFTNVNNSIAMNVVNDLLTRAGLAPLPHLLLDYLAVRMDPPAYGAAFERLVAGHDAAALLQMVAVEHFKNRPRPSAS